MSSNGQPIDGAECGFHLGIGDSGAWVYCPRCARYVLAQVAQQNQVGVLGALVLLGLGIVAAAFLFG